MLDSINSNLISLPLTVIVVAYEFLLSKNNFILYPLVYIIAINITYIFFRNR